MNNTYFSQLEKLEQPSSRCQQMQCLAWTHFLFESEFLELEARVGLPLVLRNIIKCFTFQVLQFESSSKCNTESVRLTV